MKVKTAGLLGCLAVCLCGAAVGLRGGEAALAELPEAVYSVSDFSALPDDWELNGQCDVANSTLSFEDGDMIVGNTATTSNALYYGTMYFIDKDSVYEDFTFEMRFRMVSCVSSDRWFGVMYHTQQIGVNTVGYLMNYRYTSNGQTAYSYVTEGRGFYDTASTGNPVINDGEYHTLKIVMKGTMAYQFMDDTMTAAWDTTAASAENGGHLSQALTSGGFALIVNRSSIAIDSVEISRRADAEGLEIPGDFKDGLPSDWALYAECDTANTTIGTDDNGNLVIANAGTGSEALYGGGAYLTGDKSYGDFVLEMTFRMDGAEDASSWIGVLYHTRFSGADMTGYLAKYFYDGQTAVSAVSSDRSFHDAAAQPGAPLSDGEYHTLKISVTGTAAEHYLDGKLVAEYDLGDKSDVLGGIDEKGGFALIVSRSTVSVKSYAVSGTPISVRTDNALADTYRSSAVLLAGAPTVVCDVTDRYTLDSLTAGKERPSNAVFRFNADYDVEAADGTVLGSFTEIYEKIRGSVIPVLYLADREAAYAAITYLREEWDILDLAVMSDDPSLVRLVLESNARVRGVVYYPEETDLARIVRTTNESLARVAVLPESFATQENVAYIQGRLQTVWVVSDSSNRSDLYNCVDSGAYGVICDDFGAVYDVLESYPAGSVARMPFNVAHRGLPESYNENGLEGVKAAVASGATHLELDGYLTLDGQIVIMHDETIDRTTNGTGNVESFTLDELRQYKLDVRFEEEIPTLDDVFEVLRGTDVVLVFEIKSLKTQIVGVLKEKLEEYDMWAQVVVISFSTDILAAMKTELPEIPTANLNTATEAALVSVLGWMRQYNTGVDTDYGNTNESFNAALRDRGIVGWYWTYGTWNNLKRATDSGYVGLTNNVADSFESVAMRVSGLEAEAEAVAVGDTVGLLLTDYSGAQSTVEGRVFFCEDRGSYWLVIASYSYEDTWTLYTQAYRIAKPVEEPDEPDVPGQPDSSGGGSAADSGTSAASGSSSGGAGSGCGSAALFPAAVLPAACIFALALKKRHD